MVNIEYLQAYLEALVNEIDDALYEIELAINYLKRAKARIERVKQEMKKLKNGK